MFRKVNIGASLLGHRNNTIVWSLMGRTPGQASLGFNHERDAEKRSDKHNSRKHGDIRQGWIRCDCADNVTRHEKFQSKQQRPTQSSTIVLIGPARGYRVGDAAQELYGGNDAADDDDRHTGALDNRADDLNHMFKV